MRRLRILLSLTIAFFPTFLGAASVINTATCGGVATTTADQSAAICSGTLVYATASGALTQVGNTLNISASTSSSYYYLPGTTTPSGVPARAESVISDSFSSGGPLRGGFAEIAFNNFIFRQNNSDASFAELSILVNGSKVYDCVATGGINPCATNTLSIPIELGSTFSLQVDDLSSSPAPDFYGGISTNLSVSLVDGGTLAETNVSDISKVPEPGTVGLVLVGLCVVFAKRWHSRA